MINENSAGAIIFYLDKEPHFLILKYTTYWGFVKGWIEPNETPKKTAIREAKEEAGVSIKLINGFKQEQRWFYINKEKEKVRKHAVYFLAEIPKKSAKKVKISHEHEDFKFVTLKESEKYIKIKSNKELLKKAYYFIKTIKQQKLNF